MGSSTFYWFDRFKLFKPFIKGKLGEFAVATHVKLYLKDPEYRLLNDLTLPDGEGSTTQIDHLLLSPYGLFVIETKTIKAGSLVASDKRPGRKNFIKIAINFKIRFIRIISTSKFWSSYWLILLSQTSCIL